MAALPALPLALLATGDAMAQSQAQSQGQDIVPPGPNRAQDGVRLPNGKMQRDEILRADYEQNVRDAGELSQMVSAFQLELEKSDRFVLSLGLLKRLDEIEKLTKRIRSRMKR
ncbi:MAG: hypothetical protein JWN34_3091 [Bryobacterales bacterium]|nr:hypothetical protein [Bryobacterales bacterium]